MLRQTSFITGGLEASEAAFIFPKAASATEGPFVLLGGQASL